MECLHMYLFLLWFPFKGNETQYSFSWRFPRCHKDSRGLIETAGFDPAVSLTLRDLIPRSHWNRGIWSRSLIEIALTDPAVSLRPRNPIPRLNRNRGIWTLQRLSGFSRLIRSHMQNGFSPWIRALGGNVWWNNRGWKISWHCPCKETFC
jgi:hypothetical protein